MHDNHKVLVVGTTPNYIEWIRKSCPGRAIFLTDTIYRQQTMKKIPAMEEIFCDLSDYDHVLDIVSTYLKTEDLQLNGVACYDCEAMELAAILAKHYDLPYPCREAILNCRDKYLSKKLLQQKGISCPQAQSIGTAVEAGNFFDLIKGACVLKPLNGSGSELVFSCEDRTSCEQAFNTITRELQKRSKNLLFNKSLADNHPVVIEEKINGIEFSCDFLIEPDHIDILRLTQKILAPRSPFGTIQGYALPGDLPEGFDLTKLRHNLFEGAKSLGITRAICMADFIIRENEPFILEMTPRPGGDCLPQLLWKSGKMDILKLTLDFAQQRPIWFLQHHYFKQYLGIRLHADTEGVIKKIQSDSLRHDTRVREIHLIRQPGHQVKMPPEDYDSWLLGHLIVKPFKETDFEIQCNELAEKLIVEMEV